MPIISTAPTTSGRDGDAKACAGTCQNQRPRRSSLTEIPRAGRPPRHAGSLAKYFDRGPGSPRSAYRHSVSRSRDTRGNRIAALRNWSVVRIISPHSLFPAKGAMRRMILPEPQRSELDSYRRWPSPGVYAEPAVRDTSHEYPQLSTSVSLRVLAVAVGGDVIRHCRRGRGRLQSDFASRRACRPAMMVSTP